MEETDRAASGAGRRRSPRPSRRPTDRVSTPPPMSLLRSNLVVATGTALSRVTGLLRVVVFGYVIGQTALADAYTIGNETPNIVYELLSAACCRRRSCRCSRAFVEREDEESTNVVITVDARRRSPRSRSSPSLAAPLIFRLYTLDPAADVDADAVPRGRHAADADLPAPDLLLRRHRRSATALLNARRRFFAAAWRPILSNLVIIATLLSLPRPATATGRSPTCSTTTGCAGRSASAPRRHRRDGARARPRRAARPACRCAPGSQFRHPAVRQLLRLSGWTLGYVVANQVTVVVVRNLADPGSGDARAYFNAFTFFVLPHGLLAVSIATTFVPEMARSVARRDQAAFCDQASLGIRLVALLTLPAGVADLRAAPADHRRPAAARRVHARPTPTTRRGPSAGSPSASSASRVYLFVLRGFYAHQDTRTPFVINVVENVLNIVLAFVARRPLRHPRPRPPRSPSPTSCARCGRCRCWRTRCPGFPLRDVLRQPVADGRGRGRRRRGDVARRRPRRRRRRAPCAWPRVIVGAIVGIAVYVGVLAAAPGARARPSLRSRLPGRRRADCGVSSAPCSSSSGSGGST